MNYTWAPMYKAFLLFSLAAVLTAQPGEKTPPVDLLRELIRGSAALEQLRVAQEKELATISDPNQKLFAFIHFCTRMSSELRTQQGLVNSMSFEHYQLAQFATFLASADEMRAGYFDRMKEVVKKILADNHPSDFDAGAEVAKIPEMRADIEDLNKMVATELTVGIGLSLRAKNDEGRWNFTKTEKKDLIEGITSSFDAKALAAKEPGYFVVPGKVLLSVLQNVKASDE